jgi:hypothetical protein
MNVRFQSSSIEGPRCGDTIAGGLRAFRFLTQLGAGDVCFVDNVSFIGSSKSLLIPSNVAGSGYRPTEMLGSNLPKHQDTATPENADGVSSP